MRAKELKEISNRGRVAYAICCLENALSHENIIQNDDAQKVILQQLWHFTSDNMALWEIQIVEMIPFVVNEESEYNIDDFDFFSYKFYIRIKNYYKKCSKVVLSLINLIYELGRTNIYVTIDNDKLKETTLPYLQNIIDLMEHNRIPLPDVRLFKKFPITENQGWGREFTRDEIFND